MNPRRAFVVRIMLITLGTAPSFEAQAQGQLPSTPSVPGKSLPNPGHVTRTFQAGGIETVVLRAEAAEKAEVKTSLNSRFVTVSGVPEGDAAGYHPADPSWRETLPSKWGLDFRAKTFGPTLVLSTEKEILYIHHYYHLSGLSISVPAGVKVIKENRKLTGEGAADLSPPDKR